jgi:hypothetical protein
MSDVSALMRLHTATTLESACKQVTCSITQPSA